MQGTIQRRIIGRFREFTDIRATPVELAFFAGISALVYWLAFVRPASLLEHYGHTRADLLSLYPAGSSVHLGIVMAFVELTVFYVLAYLIARRLQGKAAWAVLFGGSLAFGAILLYLFPIDAADIFDYIIHGRIWTVYGGNPYTQQPKQFAIDPFYPYVAWKGEVSPYGPVWGLLAGLASRLAGDGIVANVIAYKLIPGAFLLGSQALVALILRRAAHRQALAGTLLLAWNPVVLYETWGNGHNDMVMVFWVLAAVWAIQNRRFTLAVLALLAGTLVKFVPALLIPAAVAIALGSLPGRRERLSYLARTGVAVASMAALLYAPFWAGPKVITVVTRTNLFTSSIPAAAYYLLRPELGTKDAAAVVSKAALALTAVYVLWQAWNAWREHTWQDFVQASFNILAFYLLVTCMWFQQWYTLWLLGLAPLVSFRPARWLAILFGVAALSKTLVVGPYLFWPRYRFHQPWLEIWFTLGVLGIPWLFALFSLWKSRQPRPQAARSR